MPYRGTVDRRHGDPQTNVDTNLEESQGPIPLPVSDAAHLRLDDADGGRVTTVGGYADGTHRLDLHCQNLQPVYSR